MSHTRRIVIATAIAVISTLGAVGVAAAHDYHGSDGGYHRSDDGYGRHGYSSSSHDRGVFGNPLSSFDSPL